jgi:D-alanyl-D-alanine endopeptidase (penicillin-binding protein 7)
VSRLVIAVLVFWCIQGLAWAGPSTASKTTKQGYNKSSLKKAKPRPASLHKVHAKTSRAPAVRMVAPIEDDGAEPTLKSTAVFVLDPSDGRAIYSKNINAVQQIASITKLMTAMVVLDANLELGEFVEISQEDVDALKHTRSRLQLGTLLTRDDLLRLALMASENRAAAALARAYPGGTGAFVRAMNRKADELEMHRTRFVDSR